MGRRWRNDRSQFSEVLFRYLLAVLIRTATGLIAEIERNHQLTINQQPSCIKEPCQVSLSYLSGAPLKNI